MPSRATRSHPSCASSASRRRTRRRPATPSTCSARPRAVVGVDTGLTHLAVQQGTPTVTICRTPAVFFRPWPHTRAVTRRSAATTPASPSRREYAYNDRVDLRGLRWQPRTCPVGGRCLDRGRTRRTCHRRTGAACLCIIEVDAHPESRVHNSQPHGIGRVAALDGLWAWNNLGRNVVFAGEDFGRAPSSTSPLFAEDEPSQYDLDVHAILDVPSLGIVVTLNHFGMVRAFSSDAIRRPGPLRRVDPGVDADASPPTSSAWSCSAIGSSDPAHARDGAPGTPRHRALSMQARRRTRSSCGVRLETLGMVTALAAIRDGRAECIAVGGSGQVSLVAGDRGRRRSTTLDRRRRLRAEGRPLGRRARVGGGQRSGGAGGRRLRLGSARRRRVRRARPGGRARRRPRSLPGGPGLGQRRRRRGARARRAVRHRTPGRGVHRSTRRDGTPAHDERADRRTRRSASRMPRPWAISSSTASIAAGTGSHAIRVPRRA